MNHFFNRELVDWSNAGFSADDTTLPAVNILEDGERIQIDLAAPGMKKEDFKIDLDRNRLTISAEMESQNEENNNRYSRKEFNYSSFRRMFTIPVEVVNSEQVQAQYKDGILTVTLPKREEVKPKPARSIEIQ
ncbi:MAG: Hsp20/alpha crystallin family protein [Marinilabiliales bacterium]|nr:Hsp20/alpha crystallin family protein [Marinilabiliales bacterium]